MAVSSSPFGFRPDMTGRTPRNQHLTRDLPARAEAMLKNSAKEASNAYLVHPVYVAYYRRLRSGARCSCRVDAAMNTVDLSALRGAVDLSTLRLDVPGAAATPGGCPLCLDTGIVGGYERVGCMTLVMDARKAEAEGAALDAASRPACLRFASGGGSVSWRVRMPSHFVKALDLVLLVDSPPDACRAYVDGSPVSQGTLLAAAGKEITLEVRAASSSPSQGVHGLALVLQASDSYLVPADFPLQNKTHSGDFSMPDEIESPIAVNFDSSIGMPSDTDCFLDTRWRRVWRVLSAEINAPFRDDRAHVIDSRLQCRKVNEFEAQYALFNKAVSDTYPVPRHVYLL